MVYILDFTPLDGADSDLDNDLDLSEQIDACLHDLFDPEIMVAG